MKKLIFIFYFLINTVFAQVPTQQVSTPFDRFINKPDIEWAAYINDTIRFEKFFLNGHLLKRLSNNEIKGTIPVGAGSYEAQQIKFLSKKEIDDKSLRTDTMQVIDPNSPGGNGYKMVTVREKIDTSRFHITDAKQILYVQNGKIQSYIPWVATMIPVVTSFGTYLGEKDYFSSCFNFLFNSSPAKTDRNIFLSQSRKRILLDSFDVKSKLKELYGRNLLQTIWPYILKNRYALYSVDKKKKLKLDELNTSLVNDTENTVPVFDADGNMKGYTAIHENLTPESFTSIDLIQDWYYDQTKNMVFVTNREIYLNAKKRTAEGEASVATPVLKIVIQ